MDDLSLSHGYAEAQISDFDLEVFSQKDVLGLQVAVDQRLFLQFQQSVTDLLDELSGKEGMEGCGVHEEFK
jgi:hypothetical protein